MYRGGTENMLAGLSYLRGFPVWDGRNSVSIELMRLLMEELGNPQDQVKTVHVAGTNGKGSVSVLLASMLGADGYSVGLTTSPHLAQMNERVVVDGLPITDELLDRYARVIQRAAERCGIELSFFLAITAVAFLAFADLELEWAVIETGMGGRLDGTNVIARPEVTAIVTVDMDHASVLGSSLGKIAKEKAGIAKAGVPMVVGDLSMEALAEVELAAKAVGSQLFRLGREFSLTSEHVSCGLVGSYQLHNLSVAIQMARLLGISDDAIKLGAKNAHWPARFEEFHLGHDPLAAGGPGSVRTEICAGQAALAPPKTAENRLVIIDSAHNEAGITALVMALAQRGFKRVSLGFGALQDKEWRAMVDLLRPIVSEWHVLTPESVRAVQANDVVAYLSSFNISATAYDSPQAFYDVALASPKTEPLVLCGSIYLVGQLREVLKRQVGVDQSKFCRPLWERNRQE